jgi:sugar phosphate permease
VAGCDWRQGSTWKLQARVLEGWTGREERGVKLSRSQGHKDISSSGLGSEIFALAGFLIYPGQNEGRMDDAAGTGGWRLGSLASRSRKMAVLRCQQRPATVC